MTLVEYGERMERLLKLATEKTHDGIITPAANRMLATIKNRIQQKGENTDGSKIGQYSKKKCGLREKCLTRFQRLNQHRIMEQKRKENQLKRLCT